MSNDKFVPGWVKTALDDWTASAGITGGNISVRPNGCFRSPRYEVDFMAYGQDFFLTRVRSCDAMSALGYLALAELVRSRRVQDKKEPLRGNSSHEFSQARGSRSFR